MRYNVGLLFQRSPEGSFSAEIIYGIEYRPEEAKEGGSLSAMKMALLLFVFGLYLFCLEVAGKTLVRLMILELIRVRSAGVFAFSGGNLGFLFIIFCLMGVEIRVVIGIFVAMVRQKGDTRVIGVNVTKRLT